MNHSKGRHRPRILGRPWRAAAALGVLVAGAAIGATAASAAVAPGTRTTSAAAAGATLKLRSSSGLPGQSVGFTGSGYRAGELVAVRWRSASGTKLARLTASKTGTISGGFRVPLPRAGVAARVTVVAVGAKSKHVGRATFTQSCGDEWTGLKGGNWSDTADWSRGAVPGSTTNACITLAGASSYTVVLNQLTGTTAVGSLRVGSAGGKTAQTLEMDASGSDQYLGFGHTSTITSHGVFRLTSAGGGSDFLQGPGTLDNYGLLSTVKGSGWSRYLYGNIVNEASGTFSVAAGSLPSGNTEQTSLSTFVNKGTIKVARGSEYDVSQASLTQSGGRIANSGLVLVSNGTITKSGGTSTGDAWQLINGVILRDKAGSGSYTYYNGGTLSGTIPAGQTVTVYGNGADVQLELSGNVTNDGTLVMTSGSYDGNGGSNAWLFPLTGTPTLYNYGTIRTLNGVGWTRYFNVNVVNEARGTMDLGAGSNQLVGGETMTSDGTLNVGDGAILKLVGTSYGDANLIEGGTARTGIVLDGAKTSEIDQYACSAGGCQTDVIDLAGTLNVTAVGTPVGSYIPIHSEFSSITTRFASSTASYGVAYNQPDTAVPGVVGDVEITAP